MDAVVAVGLRGPCGAARGVLKESVRLQKASSLEGGRGHGEGLQEKTIASIEGTGGAIKHEGMNAVAIFVSSDVNCPGRRSDDGWEWRRVRMRRGRGQR